MNADEMVAWTRGKLGPLRLSRNPRERIEALYTILEEACALLDGDHTDPRTRFSTICHHLAGYILELEGESFVAGVTNNLKEP